MLPRLLRNKNAAIGGALVLVLFLFAFLGPLLSSHDPLTSDFVHGVGADQHPVGPSATFLFGADILFRDEFVRLAYGARLSLLVATAATAIATGIGAAVGIVSGFYEGTPGVVIPWLSLGGLLMAILGWVTGHGSLAVASGVTSVAILILARRLGAFGRGVHLNWDVALMRLVDVGLAFPFLLLVMAIGAALERTSPATIMLILGLTGWLGIARLIRSKALVIRNLDFVTAARALGQTTPRILLCHVAPNVAGPLIVIGTISIAQMIVAESVLSYLGVGVAPPMPSWGQMLFQGQDYFEVAPWALAFPAAVILLAVLGFNLLGEGLRDALDPHED